MDKATIERITQLSLAAQGKKTKRPVDEILKSEKAAGAQFPPSPPATGFSEPLPAAGEENP